MQGEIMLLKIVLDEGAQMPCKAHKEDAGYDLYSPESAIVPARESVSIDTGVHVAIPEGYVGMLKSKSGLNVKYGITSEGVIDALYSGSIVVKLYNHSTQNYVVNAGDKITQLVIIPIADTDLVLTDELWDSERGSNGFGSSGK